MAITTITISVVGGSIQVTPDAPVLRKSRNDQAKWKGNPPNLNFVVSFGDKTPFEHGHFNKDRPGSGPITIEPSEAEEYFTYSVEVDKKVLDPGIIITP